MRRSLIVSTLCGLFLLAACAAPPSRVARPATPATIGQYKIGTPYQINGVWYYPGEDLTYDETGIASWYGEDFHGKYTANGEVFDLNALTAAHRTLPMPSIVRVTNLENGRSLELRVNDRGPYLRGRIIDVSRRAAQLLGFEGPGTAKVRVQIMAPESIQAKLIAEGAAGQLAAESASAVPIAPVETARLSTPPGAIVARNDVPVLPPSAPPAAVTVPTPTPPPLPLSETVTTVPVRPTNIYIQAGAFARAENAIRLKAKLDDLGTVRVTGTTVNGASLYRVRIGPVGSVGEADQLLERVVDSGVPEARIVVD